MKALTSLILAVILLTFLAWKLCYVPKATAAPSLPQQWHEQTYGLDEGESVRLIAPPYSPKRAQLMAQGMFRSPAPVVRGQLAFQIGTRQGSPPGITLPFAYSSKIGDLKMAVQWCIMGEEWGIEHPLGNIAVDGDWFLNRDVSTQRRSAALASILTQVSGKQIVIEKRLFPRNVLVARGTWKFVPLDLPDGGHFKGVHFYVDEGDRTAAVQAMGSGRFAKFRQLINSHSVIRFIDETEGPKPDSMLWSESFRRGRPNDSAAALDQYLLNVQKQTSLRFHREIRQLPAWYVHERTATTQPGERR
jgi:hypothetical protein